MLNLEMYGAVKCLFMLYFSFETIAVECLGQFGMLSGIQIPKGFLKIMLKNLAWLSG